ncbi:uncharacterized protein G2W53_024936 [Senna tora]|uniref:Uncharacterized protein n=1 Tax=Senna tora TaxID=362788 RepID=A0A834TE25_9FABA|nr:uncharacterized protein G2W53_024936 [Senna tora]
MGNNALRKWRALIQIALIVHAMGNNDTLRI